MAEAATVETTVQKKPASRKAPRRRAATRKTTARKTAAKRPAARKRAAPKSKVSGTMKEVMYAQLGVYGKLYDEVNTRVSRVRKDAPKQWNELVKRGERVQEGPGQGSPQTGQEDRVPR